MQTFHFETELTRGRTERAWPVDVTYRADADSLEIVHVAISDETYPVTSDEYDWLHDCACADAEHAWPEYLADRDDFVADYRADEVMLRSAQA